MMPTFAAQSYPAMSRKKTIPQKRAEKQGIVLIQTSMRVPVDLWRRAKRNALDQGITIQSLLARAIDTYLEAQRAV